MEETKSIDSLEETTQDFKSEDQIIGIKGNSDDSGRFKDDILIPYFSEVYSVFIK